MWNIHTFLSLWCHEHWLFTKFICNITLATESGVNVFFIIHFIRFTIPTHSLPSEFKMFFSNADAIPVGVVENELSFTGRVFNLLVLTFHASFNSIGRCLQYFDAILAICWVDRALICLLFADTNESNEDELSYHDIVSAVDMVLLSMILFAPSLLSNFNCKKYWER